MSTKRPSLIFLVGIPYRLDDMVWTFPETLTAVDCGLDAQDLLDLPDRHYSTPAGLA